MPAAGEWFSEISPKKEVGGIEAEHFGDDFDGCLTRAATLARERSKTHHIRVHAPSRATDRQLRQLREAGFETAF